MPDIGDWLRSIKLEAIEPLFREQNIEFEVLRDLTDQDLREIGISLGHRKRLLRAIAEIVEEDIGTQSDPVAGSAATEDRRPVAVLFIDLAGSTVLSEKLDPEELHRVLGVFLDAVDDVIRSFGGTVDKHLGDGVLAIFGAPVAYGNDVVRAARAACAAMSSMREISDKAGHQIAAHAGLAVGDVVAGRVGTGAKDYTVIGDTVNLASRLDDLAQPGEILIDAAAADALRNQAQIEDLGTKELQGFSRSIGVWRLECVHEASSDIDLPPLIGRGAELAQAVGVLDACLSEGYGGAILLRGEPGIGKTRLLAEVEATALENGFETHKALTLHFGAGTGHGAVETLARSLVGFRPEDTPDRRSEKSVEAARASNLASNKHACLNEMLGVQTDDELRQIFDAMDNDSRSDGKRQALLALLKQASTVKPQLIAMEDIHWADETSLPIIESLISGSRNIRAVIILTTRTSGDPFETRKRDVSNLPMASIDLAPLRPQAALELARLNLSDRDDLLQTCVERAGGNPLFLSELSRSTVADPAALPATLHQAVLARVDELEPIDQEAVRAASIFGQRFELANLRKLLGREDFDCTRLLAKHLVKRDDDAFLFAHALVQEGVYRTLLKPDRAALHGRAADLFAETDPVLYARHLALSGSPAAARALVAAAEIERGHYRPDNAIKLADQAAEMASVGKDVQDAAILKAQILVELGRTADAIAAWDQAAALATEEDIRGRALLGKAEALRLRNESAQAFTLLDQAEPLLEQSNRTTDLAWLSHLRGNLYFLLGEQEKSSMHHRLALDRAEDAQAADIRVAALCGLAEVVYGRGAMESARRLFRDGIAAAREIGQLRTETANLPMLGATHFFCLDFDASLAELERSIELSERIGHLRAEYIGRSAIDWVLFQRGDLTRCRAHHEACRELLVQLDAKVLEILFWEKAAKIAVLEGDEQRAVEQFQRAADISRQTSFKFAGPRVLGQMAPFVSDFEVGRGVIDEALGALNEGALAHNHMMAYPEAIDFALHWEQWEDAKQYIQELEKFGVDDQLAWSRYYGERGRALLALGRDEADKRTEHTLTRLLATATSLGWEFEIQALRPALDAAKKRKFWRLPRRIEIAKRASQKSAS